ncbi:phenylalanine--tRNA ligase subunit beta [Hoyosella rhizosphaerae]|uniref:Phenylalanine--tRNA ligase beta subunit n=1 Tax=Hoyosella rhizosphaerae TaxID=1755582 RepID=A0A916XH62_9ACTN|nr:phenylalanine--tRNA ligase subunit beta [Hoyosella rhizosphaerae]MBN4925500.1 phenylalanine--tRNA ligase subunit beta [Hoyosella rhizosphaerae]GGC70136.1 phenylalanine--tRNA ligase beta subunit [Hoyosella rhizosphaerae]
MRVAQSWLTEIIQRANPGWEVTPAELDAGFVNVGLEVEEVVQPGPVTGPLVVARVSTIEELTEFKKPIRFCTVDTGEDAPRDIVCGAQNFSVGDLVVVALPGAVLPGDFAIATRKTYGRTSDGMICSAKELGLGRDHAGILVLPVGTAAPGDDAHKVLGLSDSVIELAVTPDRGYCLSVRGLTRELCCGFGLLFADPAHVPVHGVERPTWGVSVEPDAGAQRFALRRVTGVDTQAVTPWWMQRRLLLSGIRPISPAVDVTNYVLLELGQPMHAFDASKVSGDLVVRRAKRGEKLVTLDDVTRELDPEDVVIADDSGPLSLAGVMGGASTEVGDATTEVLLEAACWNPLLVFRTSRRHKLSSESSRRFERAVDPALTVAALDRAAELLAEITGGVVESELTDVGMVPERAAIKMPVDLPDRIAGVTYEAGAARFRLEQIGASVLEEDEDGEQFLVVTPPSWRPDLGVPADLVEEVLRLEGLDVIPSVLPAAPAGRGLTALQLRRRSVSKALAHHGCVEVQPSPFISPGVFDQWGLDDTDARRKTVRVLNPLDSERASLATTLLPGLLDVVARNVSRGQRDLALYAIGQVVLPQDNTRPVPMLPVDRRPSDEQLEELFGSLPDQPVRVGVILTGLREPTGPWGRGRVAEASDAFAAAEAIADAAGVVLQRHAGNLLPWHPGRCAELVVDGVVVGHAGELHPAVVEAMHLPPRACAVEMELDGLPIVENLPAPELSVFPAVHQDVAVVVDDSVPAADVENSLRAGAGSLLEEIRLFDVFSGTQLGEGKKSLAYSLRFRASDRTLTEDEATAARDAAVDRAHQDLGAHLR